MTLRARILLGLLLAAFGVVGLRAFHIQVVGDGRVRSQARKQSTARIPLVAKRGEILDRTGSELAVSAPARSVFVQPHRMPDPERAAEVLALRLGRPASELRASFASGKAFFWVARQVRPDEADDLVRAVRSEMKRALESRGRKVEQADLGIGFVEEPRRYYPNRELAGAVVGFTDRDNKGIEGIELSLNRYLTGEVSSLVARRDARGNVIIPPDAEVELNAKGHTVALTIDRNVQHFAETELRGAAEKHSARGGTSVVMNPKTGEVLAMASWPFYNPNLPASAPPEARRNRVIADTIEPGSTFKVFTIAAALEAGVVKETDRFDCENGRYVYGRRVIHDDHPHGWLSVPEVLKYSSNIGTIKVGDRMDADRLYDSLRSFGFGDRTGVELKGEVVGIVPSRASFRGINRATAAFGQGISVTPIQLASAMCAVVNGGKVMRPWIVREVKDPAGKTVYRGAPAELRRVISPKTSEAMRRMMATVVEEDGTGKAARIQGFRVGGKTGTAQKVEPGTGRYSPTKRVSSFIGFLPMEDPELVALVVLDEPKGVTYGGVVAAPAFERTAVKTAYYLGIRPTEPTAASARGAAPARQGSPVLARVSTAPAAEGVMPDLSGMSMGRVADVLGRHSVHLVLQGSGTAKRQSPPPGAPLVPGCEVVVTFGGR
jgi:cell division protein FtsI (penicillin-binding protein 3)